MDKRYIKLGDELVEIVCMDTARNIFAPVSSPVFRGTASVDYTDPEDKNSVVNVRHLTSTISKLESEINLLKSEINILKHKG